jgi:hypothetical protein
MAENAPTELIDVHTHLIPQDYLTSMSRAGISDVGGFPMPDWSVQIAVDMTDHHGIAASLLSISAPGIDFVSGEASRLLARSDLTSATRPTALDGLLRITAADHLMCDSDFPFLSPGLVPEAKANMAQTQHSCHQVQSSGQSI